MWCVVYDCVCMYVFLCVCTYMLVYMGGHTYVYLCVEAKRFILGISQSYFLTQGLTISASLAGPCLSEILLSHTSQH